nr:uncharacterized protein LOC114819173 isoform X2 [Malus domestica]
MVSRGFRFLFFWNFCLQLWKTFVLKEKLRIRSNVYCKSCCSNFPVFICSFASSLSTSFFDLQPPSFFSFSRFSFFPLYCIFWLILWVLVSAVGIGEFLACLCMQFLL